MPELFSADWMNELKDQWNNAPDVKDALAEIGFNSLIGCGFKDEAKPRGVFVVENGVCVRAGDYNDETLDWDMRANRKDWMKWVENGIGMAGLGMAYTTGKLKFVTGDYGAMLKNPKMAGPFIKSFGLMSKIDTQ
ncbi:MAG: SCP-2 sterol transfer family protein [Thiofilum sp.]|uniref:SCP-2 sterol transfer family protein n=1 Tax=Thiofilum sp. TaxID=2212733 RepID=UPI002600E498|nr:SCP-2 sterol transfer family protein [Thiofilum sp.]MBK8452451.1 SCP-2 sterol transfer family protein [Thiofilum sp.]